MKIKLSLLFLICYLISFSQNFDKKVNDLILNYENEVIELRHWFHDCLLYTSPSPRDRTRSRMPSSA